MLKAVSFCVLMIIPTFKEIQLTNARVRHAYAEKETIVKRFFNDAHINYAGFNMFLRVFKKEKIVEVWVSQEGKEAFILLQTYPFCSSSGTLGPKRKEGDMQIPEGVYTLNHFNPESKFYLSLGINYPNASDKILGDKAKPGSDIYLHGNCVTVGCIPLTDEKIKELYILAVEARNNGQEKIPVHIFPARLSVTELISLKNDYPLHGLFWGNLKYIYDDFEQTKKLKVIYVNGKGEYTF